MEAITTKIGFIPAAEDLTSMQGRAVALQGAHKDYKHGLWQLPRTQKASGLISQGSKQLGTPSVIVGGVTLGAISPNEEDIAPGDLLTPDYDGYLKKGGSFCKAVGHGKAGGYVDVLLFPIETAGTSSLMDGQVLKYSEGTNELIYAGATVDPLTGVWTFDNSINVPQASVKISEVISISEATFTAITRDNVLSTSSISPTSVIDDTGSNPVEMLAATYKQIVEAQEVDSYELIGNPLTSPLLASRSNQTDAVTIRVAEPMTNVRMIITDNNTGTVVKYIPSRAAWDSQKGGLDFRTGENRVDFNSDLADDPLNGLFYLGFTPLRQFKGQQSTLTVMADSMHILGNSSGIPYFRNEIQFLESKKLPFSDEVMCSEESYLNLNSSHLGGSSLPGGFTVTTRSLGIQDTSLGLFLKGIPNVSNPSVTTEGVGTFSEGDLVQISGTRFNNCIVEVLSHLSNTLTIKGEGLVSALEGFTATNFMETLEEATLSKVNVAIVRVGSDSRLEQAQGSQTPLSYQSLTDLNTPSIMLDTVMTSNLTCDTSLEEKILNFDVSRKARGITLLNNGEILVSESGTYNGHLILQVNETSDPTIFVWIEVKPAATGTWELSGGMARTKFKEDTSWTLTLDGSLDLQAGDIVRTKIMMQGQGTDQFTLENITQSVTLGTLLQPAAHLEIVRQGAV